MGLTGRRTPTLIKCCAGLLSPTAGQVMIGGQHITRMHAKDITELGRQKPRCYSSTSLCFLIGPWPTTWRSGSRSRVSPRSTVARGRLALQQVGLADWAASQVSQLSGEMRQRVGIARVLVVEPESIVFDEPSSGPDPLIRKQMQDRLCCP